MRFSLYYHNLTLLVHSYLTLTNINHSSSFCCRDHDSRPSSRSCTSTSLHRTTGPVYVGLSSPLRNASTTGQSACFCLLGPELGSCLTASRTLHIFTSAKPHLSCNVQRCPEHDSLSNFSPRNIQTILLAYQVPIHVERTKVDLINDTTNSA